ncbi:MAG: peptidoglycan-binding domain-containing protein [Myxococcota bacterium]
MTTVNANRTSVRPPVTSTTPTEPPQEGPKATSATTPPPVATETTTTPERRAHTDKTERVGARRDEAAVQGRVNATFGAGVGGAPSVQDIRNGAVLQEGQAGTSVKELQERLAKLGHSGPTTGVFTAETTAQVKAFQRAHGVGATGKIGPQTLGALERAEREAAHGPRKPVDTGPYHAVRQGKSAYFHKVSSESSSSNQGIEGRGTLPQVDIKRTMGTPGNREPLDIPSVYMGGHANGKEADVGLSWSRRHDQVNGTHVPTFTDRPEGTDGGDPRHRFTKVGGVVRNGLGEEVKDPEVIKKLEPNYAFRVFWRTTNKEPKLDDKGNVVKENGKTVYSNNQWHNPPPGLPNQYFYPGDKIQMSVKVVGDEKVQVSVGKLNEPRHEYTSAPFTAQGFTRDAEKSFKRVNSIDQFVVKDGKRKGIESLKLPVQDTQTTVTGGGWDEVRILQNNNRSRPLNSRKDTMIHGTDVDLRSFQVSGRNARGGEYVDIVP